MSRKKFTIVLKNGRMLKLRAEEMIIQGSSAGFSGLQVVNADRTFRVLPDEVAAVTEGWDVS